VNHVSQVLHTAGLIVLYILIFSILELLHHTVLYHILNSAVAVAAAAADDELPASH
jgi:hypothetical protein